MTHPKWNDPHLNFGTMIRGALWLLGEIGEGNTFTKEQLRNAFPGVSQVDRRIRDLRKYEWVILASTEDASLHTEEQRFVSAGVRVWEPEERRKVEILTITAKERQLTFAADGYQCVFCGIAGGESYSDSTTESAQLSVSRRPVRELSGDVRTQLVTECRRCRAGSADTEEYDLSRWLTDSDGLGEVERRTLKRWMARGRRGPTPIDRLWTAYLRLPSQSKEELRSKLNKEEA
ncbi:hypothetical protein E2F48_05180 [Arthrobacter crusticola]|uniref:HNH endonuclease n=1 Tax=Arthrobacter crusticola TaxID=2547960 RepID=A0A4R5TZC9_9MICC|nr:hypothetical protein [Arthrobacter crusticola]TDK26583.1 hypothetical protein E2F48_05180 [Arthrobacter crusticola]